MRKIILFFGLLFISFSTMAQNYPFSQKWSEVDKLSNQGNTKSLIPLIDEIYLAAKEENQDDDVIKALIYSSKIAIRTSDDENITLEVRDKILDEIEQSEGVRKSTLQSILGQLYFNYLNEEYYRIHDRTNLADNQSADFRTWSTAKFLEEIHHLIQASVQDKNQLFGINPNQVQILLHRDNQYRFLQPTLYDILANKALEIYKNFRFSDMAFDQEIRRQKIEDLYSNLIKIHSSDKDKSSLIQKNIEFLEYKNEISPDFDIISELKALDSKFESEPWSTNILATLASHLKAEDQLIEAVKVTKLAQERFPETFGASRAKAIQDDIEYPSLSLITEGDLYAHQYNQLIIKHKNINQLFYRVYALNADEYVENHNGFKYIHGRDRLEITGNLILEGNIPLKEFNDFQSKTTKYAFPPIPAGNYVILVSENNQFSGKIEHHLSQLGISSTLFDVSHRFVMKENKTKRQFQIVNKSTGLPMVNQDFTLLKSTDQGSFKNIMKGKTDDFGRAHISQDKTYNYRDSYVIQLPQENTFFPVFLSSHNRNLPQVERTTEVKFFTDRAIYRPGQTVYFKGILFRGKANEKQIVKNNQIKVVLRNANGEEISTISLTSNEFGSVHGEFVLPTSGLTGIYHISDNLSSYGNHYFHVEEYKRPRFEVEIDSLTDIYKIDEKVKVSGNAKTFSGANVNGAKVVYRVFRTAFNPYGWWWPPRTVSEFDIVSGETTTDDNGNFEFNFNALPDESEKEGKRAYRYKIVVDVTDISGETRSTQTDLKVGDIPLSINLIGKEKYSIEEFNNFLISTKNLNGMDTEASGEFEITEISKVDRVLRNQQIQVDYELLEREDLISKLPYIAYENEHLIENRKRGQTILTQKWDTSISDTIQWSQQIPVGIYELKAKSIYKNDTIESLKIVEVYDPQLNSKQNTFFDVILNQNSFQPGETAEINFVSDAHSAHVIVELEANNEIVKTVVLSLNNSNSFEFPILEEYRGGVFVHVYFNKFNESVGRKIPIQVPFDNKKLEFSVSTMRDKIEPGQNETWTLTVKDNKGDVFLAEVLASMYDKSLDQFAPNPYSFSVFGQRASGFSVWSSESQSTFRNLHYRRRTPVPHLSFESLNLFGLTLNERLRRYIGYHSLTENPPIPMEVRSESRVAEKVIAADASAIGLGDPGSSDNITIRGSASLEDSENALYVLNGKIVSKEEAMAANATQISVLKGEEAIALYGERGADGVIIMSTEKKPDLNQIQVRTNLQETAFFFPNLKTDEEGNVKIEFTSPESLTQWNFQAVAHTEDLKIGTYQADIITQKELMVVPNSPRFLREGDRLTFKSQIMNLSEQTLNGNAKLFLFDAFTMQPIDAKFELKNSEQAFSVDAGGNTVISWDLKIPQVDEVQSVVYRIVAGNESFSDGEENALPILSNRMLVTETMPIHIRENQSKTFTFEKLAETTSDTRENFNLSMEMTTNPIWYAVMSLPYLREYPYECSEQIFGRLYGNLISQSIVNSNPKIKAVFDDWNKKGQLISPLEKNESLKNILLEETPWLRDAQSESEQMKRVAILFDLNQMRNELQNTYRKLEQQQSDNGGFAWFEGGKENFYITTHIVSGFGHLRKMNILENSEIQVDLEEIPTRAIGFIDKEMEQKWDKFQADPERYDLNSYMGVYWLYARSFYPEIALSKKLQDAKNYILKEVEKDKFNQGLKTQSLLALILNRYGESEKAKELIFAIKDRSVESDEMGMYWKENVAGYFWYQAPIETQALAIEAFDEITPEDTHSVESMKVWLLKNKQTNRWSSTKATTEAVYALMNTGKDWTDAEKGIQVKIGDDIWLSDTVKPSNDVQAGSGYVKTSWNKSEIQPEMAVVSVEKTSPGVAWGAMYWQYFEDLDKITQANTGVRFNKQLFIQKNTAQGPQLFEINDESQIKIGDLVKVRLEIQTDRAMEFVHIKDMRASGFEPVNVLSRYKWQDGLGYYESTRDAATNFFIDYLPKGVYVFEYELRANNAGNFSNGITQLQNMYAPEFSAHSEGLEVIITP